jgi:hypothetical protein
MKNAFNETLQDIDKNEPIIYNTSDIQRIFKCGKQQAYQLMNTKGFPSIRLNSKLIVEKTALLHWLKMNQGKQILM